MRRRGGHAAAAPAAATTAAAAVEAYIKNAQRIRELLAAAPEARTAKELTRLLPLVHGGLPFLVSGGSSSSRGNGQLPGGSGGSTANFAEWAEPVLRGSVVGCAAALLSALLDYYDSGQPLLAGAALLPYETAEAVQGALLTLDDVLRGYVQSAMVREDAAGERAPAVADRECARLRGRLLGQLADGEVVRALARVPAFVQQYLWPRIGTAASLLPALGNDLGARACQALTLVAEYVEIATTSIRTAAVAAASPAADRTAAAAARCGNSNPLATARRFLEDLTRSGLEAAVSAALLAAPPSPYGGATPAAAGEPDGFTAELARCQLLTGCLVRSVGEAAQVAGGSLTPLDAPAVRQLQLESLRQMAAAADQFGTEGGADEAPCSGGGGGSASAAAAALAVTAGGGRALRLWPGRNSTGGEADG